MVMEAVAIKTANEDEKLQKEAEKEQAREEFKQDVSGLDQYR